MTPSILSRIIQVTIVCSNQTPHLLQSLISTSQLTYKIWAPKQQIEIFWWLSFWYCLCSAELLVICLFFMSTVADLNVPRRVISLSHWPSLIFLLALSPFRPKSTISRTNIRFITNPFAFYSVTQEPLYSTLQLIFWWAWLSTVTSKFAIHSKWYLPWRSSGCAWWLLSPVFFRRFLPSFCSGLKKEKTNIAAIFGSNCSIAEKFINSRLRRYYFLVVSILFVLCVLVMIILYVLIWCTVKRRRGSVIGDSVKRRPSDLDNGKPMRIKKQCSTNSDDNNNSVFWEEGERASLKRGRRRRMSSVSAVLKKIKVTRTTLLLFAVTAAFVISYLPAIMAMVLKKKILRLRHGELIYTFFVKFTFINNANNPIIYSFLNVNFRNECKKVFQKVYCGKNGPPSRQTSMETEEDIK